MTRPYLGHGVGLRVQHYGDVMKGAGGVDWFEVISENFFRPGGRPLAVLESIRASCPVVLHGVALGVGSVDEDPSLRTTYLKRLKTLADRFEPAWISDHLCWTRQHGHQSHDLLPLPYTEEALSQVVTSIKQAQDVLKRPFLIENVSSYVAYAESAIPEWEFLSEVARRADCRILLDLNNIIVSATNHGFDPMDYLRGVDPQRVWQFHLANHDRREHYRFDSHRGAVPPEVWALYDQATSLMGAVSTLIEWDEDVPSWAELVAEQQKAKHRPLPSAPNLGISQGGGQRESGQLAGSVAVEALVGPGATPLRQTQELFWHLITAPNGVAAVVEDEDVATSTRATFVGTPAFSTNQRLGVYAEAYFWRLADVLTDYFAKTRALLGAIQFHNLITDYVWQHPSSEPDVGQIGAGFPQFLAAHALSAEFPNAALVAAYEWAHATVLHAPDVEVTAISELASVPLESWPELRLQAIAACAVLPYPFDLSLWPEMTDAPADRAVIAASALQGQWAVIWRQSFRVRSRVCSEAEAHALSMLSSAITFEALCEQAPSPEDVAGWLHRWVSDALIARTGR